MPKIKLQFIIVVLVLLLSMACIINIGGPDYPTASIPVSTEALISLQDEIKAAIEAGAQTGQITIFISETQLTSFLADKLSSQENPFITLPQAYLENGQIQLFGTVIKGLLKATVSIIMTASIDVDGKLQLELSSADFGPFPVPDSLKEVITSLVTEAYTGALGPVATGFKLEGIVIAKGAMMIIGQIK